MLVSYYQRRAARYVTNSHNNRSSVNQMLEHLEWKSLEQRRTDARLTMMYKITNEKVDLCLMVRIPNWAGVFY
jgi:hypothetical protein